MIGLRDLAHFCCKAAAAARDRISSAIPSRSQDCLSICCPRSGSEISYSQTIDRIVCATSRCHAAQAHRSLFPRRLLRTLLTHTKREADLGDDKQPAYGDLIHSCPDFGQLPRSERGMRCTYCGSGGHTKALCPHIWSGSSARSRLRCSYCGGRDHAYEACPKILAPHRRDPNAFILDR